MGNFPVWAFGGLVALGIFIVGGVLAGVRAITKLNTTIEYLGPDLAQVSSSVNALSVAVNTLITKVALLEAIAVKIPALSDSVGRLERDIAILSEKY